MRFKTLRGGGEWLGVEKREVVGKVMWSWET
jgi:hypothetical protein